ncbi:MAG: LytTR family DNA-binding domain-containing protein [Candidatus Pseudoruminococcus sp.]|nr:LytTR family DNA-binding domain-containing protein [Ruminococcus sp.]MDY2783902.1 LytTR family DNA-binding domain-containing protein [Candidatus Pseudoruminococcus sp.]
MLKIALCDDDKKFIELFSRMIKDYTKNNSDIVDTFISADELLKSNTDYDLIFLDIDMPKINGIQAAKYYEENNTAIVFVTNKEALVFEAYNATDSFGFIRKNKLKEDFISVIKRFEKHNQRINFLTLKTNTGIIKIKFSDIYYIEKFINSIIVHTKNENFKERNTISALENILKDFGFIRCHIGYLVNLDYISLISDKELLLSNGMKVPVSRNKIQFVKSEFLKRSAFIND